MQRRAKFMASNNPVVSPQAHALAEETGITETQAQDLIDVIGTGHSSLVREARLIKEAEEQRLEKK
jgi:hypothetical protein